jgi:hypothetical protein
MPQTSQAKDTSQSARKTAPAKPAPQSVGPSGEAMGPLFLEAALTNPLSASPQAILQLQRRYGNRAVQRLIRRAQADVQREAPIGLEGGAVGGDLQGQIDSARGGGRPLDKGVGSQIGGALGADFSGVRVHTGPQADGLNRSLSARAFTTGADIFFSQGAYDPGTHSGKQLLAHELTHVVQQGGSKANKVQTKLTVGPAGDKYEEEADQVAKQVMKMPATVQRHADGQHLPSSGTLPDDELGLQRQVTSPGLAVQAATTGPVVQREIVADWETESTVKGFLGITKPRSKALKTVDRAVAVFNKTSLGLKEERITNGTLALSAIDKWRATKTDDKASIRYAKIQLLVQAITDQVKQASDAKEQHEREMAIAGPKFDIFAGYEGEMGEHAGRSKGGGAQDFKPSDLKAGGIKDLLSRDRGSRGQLTDDVVEAFVTNDQESYLKPALEKSKQGKLVAPGDMSKEEVEALMDRYKNKYTGSTEFPELENLSAPSAEADVEVEEVKDAGGVSVTVRYNKSDSLFAKRWAMVQSAVTRVVGAGFTVPPFKLYLPKFGRQLTVSPSEGHTHQVSEGGDTEAAMFVVRNNIYMSSRTVNNPKVDTGLSVQLDPSGVATLIHEMGHYLHFHNSPSKFFGLSLSFLKGTVPGAGGKQLAIWAQEVVSKYGSGNPREFVAEIFLGMCYGKPFPDYALKIYRIFGGPIPAGEEDRFDDLTDDTSVPKKGRPFVTTASITGGKQPPEFDVDIPKGKKFEILDDDYPGNVTDPAVDWVQCRYNGREVYMIAYDISMKAKAA